ncbi:hypothetical protein FUAX_35270 [Fulvitalea axinellae]|uniref:DhaL domain-containing protein n=1 Tax=Fulvitalea axinellae TaxID=1182444 RepID=A0AAU9DIW0_9BACT|nr:hypothetical protein FUAX_35270 [Fulvitalea axinellae]
MEKITIDQFKGMINNAFEKVSARADEFSKLDAVAGDGDHGTAIVAAMGAINEAAQKGEEFKAMLGDMGFGAMSQSCGSTSTLSGALYLGMSDCAAGTELDVKAVGNMFDAGLANVRKSTKADVGNKTVMDALIPAIEALKTYEGDNVVEQFQQAAKAASEGAEKTIEMQASFGRARNMGERSIGHLDPGAASMACIFEAFASSLA